MRDIGTVTKGLHEGKEALGIKLSWDKRYITLGPKATLVGLAFRLFDPENHLGKGEDVGITLALIPANHPGVNIGRRHLPSGAAFPNGPNWGKDVFIPMDWVIGGDKMADEMPAGVDPIGRKAEGDTWVLTLSPLRTAPGGYLSKTQAVGWSRDSGC